MSKPCDHCGIDGELACADRVAVDDAKAELATLRTQLAEASGKNQRNADRAVEQDRTLRAAESQRDRAAQVLRLLTTDAMGGTPDLFWPKGGWDDTDDKIAALLKEVGATPPRGKE